MYRTDGTASLKYIECQRELTPKHTLKNRQKKTLAHRNRCLAKQCQFSLQSNLTGVTNIADPQDPTTNCTTQTRRQLINSHAT